LVGRFGVARSAGIPWSRMHPRSLLRAGIVAGVVSALSMSALATAATVKVPAWATSVCTGVGTWLDTIDHAATKAAAAAPSSPKAAKKALTNVLDQSAKATDTLVAELKKTGPAPVKNGKTLASILRSQYQQLSKSLKGSLKSLKRAKSSDPIALAGAARAVQDALESAFEQSQAAFNAAGMLDDPALVDAFLAEPACAGVTNR
jgi:hypothetical protein